VVVAGRVERGDWNEEDRRKNDEGTTQPDPVACGKLQIGLTLAAHPDKDLGLGGQNRVGRRAYR
jgi:hypothetical protein